MIRSITILTALVLASVSAPSVARADEGNSSETRIKVYRAKLRSSLERSRDGDSRAFAPCDTGNVEIGSIEAERGARVPREVTVLVEGDVINVNDGRGSRVCR